MTDVANPKALKDSLKSIFNDYQLSIDGTKVELSAKKINAYTKISQALRETDELINLLEAREDKRTKAAGDNDVMLSNLYGTFNRYAVDSETMGAKLVNALAGVALEIVAYERKASDYRKAHTPSAE